MPEAASKDGVRPRLRRELSVVHQFALSIATVGPLIVIFGFYGPIAGAPRGHCRQPGAVIGTGCYGNERQLGNV